MLRTVLLPRAKVSPVARPTISVSARNGERLFDALVRKFGADALDVSSHTPTKPRIGGKMFHLNAIKGILEPLTIQRHKQYVKILTPSGDYCQFGIGHTINTAKGDAAGRYTLVIEDIVSSKPHPTR